MGRGEGNGRGINQAEVGVREEKSRRENQSLSLPESPRWPCRPVIKPSDAILLPSMKGKNAGYLFGWLGMSKLSLSLQNWALLLNLM